MIWFTTAGMVSRACRRALVVADMPYRSYETATAACENARILVEQGKAEVVKLEGGEEQAQTVAALVDRGIPVCGHVGLQPQSIREYGGYKVQGREKQQAERIMAGAVRPGGCRRLHGGAGMYSRGPCRTHHHGVDNPHYRHRRRGKL